MNDRVNDKDTGTMPLPPAERPGQDAARGGDPPEGKARRPRRYWWIAWVLLLVPVIYFATQVFVLMMPRMRTQTAIQDTMTDSIRTRGFVVLQSVPVEASGGIVYYSVPLGQRVAQGAEVALLFGGADGAAAMAALQRLDAEIALLQDAQTTRAEGGDVDVYMKQLQSGLNQLVGVLDDGRYDTLAGAAGEVALADNRLQVVTGEVANFEGRLAALQAQRDQLAALAVPTGTVTAPQNGFFVPALAQDQRLPGYDALAAMAPEALQAALQAPPEFEGAGVVGHIVEDYKWSFFAVLPVKDAAKCTPGAKLELSFPDARDETVPVVVQAVDSDEASGLAKVELACEQMRPAIMQLRTEKADIILRTEKGIRIDKSAMRIIEGENCVYVKFGNQVFKRRIKILLEDDHYLLLPETYEKDLNEVQLYDEVVVDSGGEELYDKKVL